MSYLVLARKYRPQNFSEMVGQDHVVRALTNALQTQRLHHAYLFTGTRGVGKTTISRILAKSLNCIGPDGQGGITDQPCGVCQVCRDIDIGRFVDYVELDAASNRGVDEISQLLDQSVYKPVAGRFKVFMIDEVHMLSNTAFNAMLKTLEEPPDYLKFVLATTDPQKVPVTVLSRCLQFNLRPMAPETIFEHLQQVLSREQVTYDAASLRLMARAAHGSMRDALSLTDQAIAYGNGTIAEDAVRQMLGAVERTHVYKLIEALAAANGKAVIELVDFMRSQGLSAGAALEEMTTVLQRMAVLRVVPQALEPDNQDDVAIAGLVKLLDADEVQLLYSIALHGISELGLASDEYAALVMVLLRLLAFKPLGSASASLNTASAGALHEQTTGSAQAASSNVHAEHATSDKAKFVTDAQTEQDPQSSDHLDHLQTAQSPVNEVKPVANDNAHADFKPANQTDVIDKTHHDASNLKDGKEQAHGKAQATPKQHNIAHTQTMPESDVRAHEGGLNHELKEHVNEGVGEEVAFDKFDKQVVDVTQKEVSQAAITQEDETLKVSVQDQEDEYGVNTFANDDIPPWIDEAIPELDERKDASLAQGALDSVLPHAAQDDANNVVGQTVHNEMDAAVLQQESKAQLIHSVANEAPIQKIILPKATPQRQRWAHVADALLGQSLVKALVRELVLNSQVQEISEDEQCWQFLCAKKTLMSDANRKKMESALGAYLELPVEVRLKFGEVEDTPGLRLQALQAQKQEQANAYAMADSDVQQFMSEFPGTRIVPGSIKPV